MPPRTALFCRASHRAQPIPESSRLRNPGRLGCKAREVRVKRPVELVLLECLRMPHATRELEDVAAVDVKPDGGRIPHAFGYVRGLCPQTQNRAGLERYLACLA